MKGSVSLIAGGHAAVALGSFVAVYGLSRSLDGLARYGGTGFPDFLEAVVSAARWPMVAAWIAVGVSLLALLMLRGAPAPQERSPGTAVLAAVAMGAGVAAVLIFRTTATFIAYGHLPPGVAVGQTFRSLTSAGAMTALCFAAAVAVAVMARRACVTKRVTVLAVVLSLGVSAAMIVTLRDLSARVGTWPLQ